MSTVIGQESVMDKPDIVPEPDQPMPEPEPEPEPESVVTEPEPEPEPEPVVTEVTDEVVVAEEPVTVTDGPTTVTCDVTEPIMEEVTDPEPTVPDEPLGPQLPPLDLKTITANHEDIVTFWKCVRESWGNLYPTLMTGDRNVLVFMQTQLLNRLGEFIELEITYGQVNKQNLEIAEGKIEMYLSPRLRNANIPVMEAMYDCYHKGPAIENLLVLKYKPYHPKDALIAEIDFKAFKATYDDFGFQGSFGFSAEKKPVMNIVVMVKQPLASQILQKKTVYFNDKGQQSSREVWMSTSSNAVDLFLINILGEYNLLHHVGYIEMLPADDPLINEDAVFTELGDIRKSMEIINKQYSYSNCNYCQRHQLQVSMKRCSRCQCVNYCSSACQLRDWTTTHKAICVKKA